MSNNNPASSILSQAEQEKLINKLEIFKIHGRDKCGRTILRIIGKYFPAKLVSLEVLNAYLEEKVYPSLGERAFSVVYVHTGVNRSDNFPGIAALRSIYEAMPVKVRDHLEAVYFLHPGLQSRLFLAILGRLLFSGGLYWKVKYVNRLEFLWDHIRRKEMEIPEFVYDYDMELDYGPPLMDYGPESDHPRVYGPPTLDSPGSTYYSMRCIA